MKFQIEFNDLHEDENQLEKIGCFKEFEEEYICFSKEMDTFEDLKNFQKMVDSILEQPYTLNIDMDYEIPIIYLERVHQ